MWVLLTSNKQKIHMHWKYYTSITGFAGNHCCEVIHYAIISSANGSVQWTTKGSLILKYKNIPDRMHINALNNYCTDNNGPNPKVQAGRSMHTAKLLLLQTPVPLYCISSCFQMPVGFWKQFPSAAWESCFKKIKTLLSPDKPTACIWRDLLNGGQH